MSSSKRLPCQKEACAIQKCLQGKQTLEFCLLSYQSIELHEKNVSKKFKAIFFINLIKLKLILMSILFWAETQIVDSVDRKNSYIGTASQVLNSGCWQCCSLLQVSWHPWLAAAGFIQGPAKTSIFVLQGK